MKWNQDMGGGNWPLGGDQVLEVNWALGLGFRALVPWFCDLSGPFQSIPWFFYLQGPFQHIPWFYDC